MARAQRIADALSGLLEDPPEEAPALGQDPYRARPVRPRPRPAMGLRCPGCGQPMILVYERGLTVERCGVCGGMWLDPGEIDHVKGEATTPPNLKAIREAVASTLGPQPEVRYRKCPRCEGVMNRVNFGTLSGVIIDECREHGVYLDPDELEAIEKFVQLGGMELARFSKEERLRKREHRARQAEADAKQAERRVATRHHYASARLWHGLFSWLDW